MTLVIGPSAATFCELVSRSADALLEPWRAYHEGSPEAAEAMAQALDTLTWAERGDGDGPPRLPATVIRPSPEQTEWPACDPPVGTWAYQVHRLPEAEAHWPLPGDHVHFFLRQQNPMSGTCFWKRNAQPPHFLGQREYYDPDPDMVRL